MPCPTFEALIDFADNQLAPEAASSVETHVGAGCASCRTTIDWFSGFAAAASADLVEPPVWLTRKAVALFAQRQKEGIVSKLSRMVASLVFDSLAGSASPDFVPARSAAVGGRQLLFTALPFDVDLLVSPGDAPRTVAVSGQVLATDSVEFAIVSGLEVEFIRDEKKVASAVTSDFGEFSVDSMAPGSYDVRISDNTREIVLSGAPIETR